MNYKKQTLKYIIFDYITASIAWTLFFIFRKYYIEINKLGLDIHVIFDAKYYLGLAFLPLSWLLLYYITGQYRDVYRKSRLKEFGETILITLIGILFIFFTLILDDTILSYKSYYLSFVVLFGLHFTLTYILRFIVTSGTIYKLRNRIIGFRTLIIGGNDRAENIYLDFENQPKSAGNLFCGFINVNGNDISQMSKYITHFGGVKDLRSIIIDEKIDEVIIAIESSDKSELESIIGFLEETNVVIKAIPDLYDILTGTVKMSSIYGAPLIQISQDRRLDNSNSNHRSRYR